MKTKSRRTREIAKIKCLCRDLEISDQRYKELLWTHGRTNSAANLDAHGRQAVIRALTGDQPAKKTQYKGRSGNIDRSAEIKKIEAYLSDADRPWSYADALAKKLCKRERVTFVATHDLYKIITALEIDARRRLVPHLKEQGDAHGLNWQALEVLATGFFGLSDKAELDKNTQVMSRLRQWFAGIYTPENPETFVPELPPRIQP